MKAKLVSLRNTLSLIETKGQNTIIMAECLKFVDQMVAECCESNVPSENNESVEQTK